MKIAGVLRVAGWIIFIAGAVGFMLLGGFDAVRARNIYALGAFGIAIVGVLMTLVAGVMRTFFRSRGMRD